MVPVQCSFALSFHGYVSAHGTHGEFRRICLGSVPEAHLCPSLLPPEVDTTS